MKIYSGVDIIDIKRFEKTLDRHKEKFLNKFLVTEEIESSQRLERLAALFAAKEAISKALGTGIGQKNIGWHDFLIKHNKLGKPEVILKNEAKVRFKKMRGIDIDLSISHEQQFAIAFCLILTEETYE